VQVRITLRCWLRDCQERFLSSEQKPETKPACHHFQEEEGRKSDVISSYRPFSSVSETAMRAICEKGRVGQITKILT